MTERNASSPIVVFQTWISDTSSPNRVINRGKTYFALVDNDELSNFSYQ